MSKYPLSDSDSIAAIRKARKHYRCPAVWAHDPAIRPGELYARVKITPGMGAGWRELAYHIACLEPEPRMYVKAATGGAVGAGGAGVAHEGADDARGAVTGVEP